MKKKKEKKFKCHDQFSYTNEALDQQVFFIFFFFFWEKILINKLM